MKFLKFFLCFFTIFFLYSVSAFSFSNSLFYPNKSASTQHWLIDFALSADESVIYALNTISPHTNDSVLYVANGQSGLIIKKIPLRTGSYQLAVTASRKKAYIGTNGGISSVNLDTNKVSIISTNPEVMDYSLLVTKDGQTLYAADDYSGDGYTPTSIYLISTKFDTIETKITKQIHKKDGFQRMVFNDNETKICLSEEFHFPRSLSFLDTEKKQLHEQVYTYNGNKITRMNGILFDQLHNLLYIAMTDMNEVWVMNSINFKIIKKIPIGRLASRGAPSGNKKKLYIANRNDNTVSIIDLVNLKPIKILKVGHDPLAVHASHNGKKIYVGNASDFSISVIDTETDEVINTINLKIDGRMYS